MSALQIHPWLYLHPELDTSNGLIKPYGMWSHLRHTYD